MISRRRREFRFTEADMRMRAALGDANIVAWYDARFPWTITLDTGVSAWGDARNGTGYAPALAQATDAAQPAYSASARTVTPDGSDDFLANTAAYWNTITAAGAVVVVGTLPPTGGAVESLVQPVNASSAAVCQMRRNASNGTLATSSTGFSSPTASTVGATGTRALHSRRSAAVGGNVTLGVRVGAGAEATSVAATIEQTWDEIYVGATKAGGEFGDATFKAILIFKGAYTAALAAAVNEWARAAHGAGV